MRALLNNTAAPVKPLQLAADDSNSGAHPDACDYQSVALLEGDSPVLTAPRPRHLLDTVL
jgi:hypothetical protein